MLQNCDEQEQNHCNPALLALKYNLVWWVDSRIKNLLVKALPISGICLTAKDAAREVVVHSESSVTDNTAAWKAIRNRAAAIAAATNHPELRRLAEEIRYADPTPTCMDGQIAEMLETLSSYADADSIRKAFSLLDQRKAVAKNK